MLLLVSLFMGKLTTDLLVSSRGLVMMVMILIIRDVESVSSVPQSPVFVSESKSLLLQAHITFIIIIIIIKRV